MTTLWIIFGFLLGLGGFYIIISYMADRLEHILWVPLGAVLLFLGIYGITYSVVTSIDFSNTPQAGCLELGYPDYIVIEEKTYCTNAMEAILLDD